VEVWAPFAVSLEAVAQSFWQQYAAGELLPFEAVLADLLADVLN
jgi:hypothetical protein